MHASVIVNLGGINLDEFRQAVSPEEWKQLSSYFDPATTFTVRCDEPICRQCENDFNVRVHVITICVLKVRDDCVCCMRAFVYKRCYGSVRALEILELLCFHYSGGRNNFAQTSPRGIVCDAVHESRTRFLTFRPITHSLWKVPVNEAAVGMIADCAQSYFVEVYK